MTTYNDISQNVSINCNLSITNINSRVEPTSKVSISEDNFSHSSYRKSYIVWDKLERANKPDNYTEKTKYLSKNAKALLSVVYQKLKKQTILILNHKYISTITNSGSRQNQRIIQEIKNVVDVSYKRGITELNGKKYKNCYEFKLKNDSVNARIQKTKMSDKNTSSTIYIENNIINNRSRTNFVKNSSDSFFYEVNSNTHSDNEIENQGREDSGNKANTPLSKTNCTANISTEFNTPVTDNSSSQEKNVLQESKTLQTQQPSAIQNTNGFLDSGKYLSEMLNYLTDEMCEVIRSKCGKNYTDIAIREIAKSVSRSKKGAKAFFYHIKGFIAYLSKILTFEKRDPVKISGTNYYIAANQTKKEKEIQKQEKYLTDIEYSLQVSPEWHLKKKLASTLERSKAYNLLTSYKSLELLKGRAVITLNSSIHLSRGDKDIILKQIQATHEKTDDAGNYLSVEYLDIISPNKSRPFDTVIQQEKNFPKRAGLWGQIRETFASYFESEGDAIDKSWLSKLKVKIDRRKKTIELEAPSPFVKDWVENNYLRYVEDATKENGLFLVGVSCK